VIKKLLKQWPIVILCLVGCIIYSFIVVNRATVNLNIKVEKKTVFKIYWSNADEEFSEKRVAKIKVKPEQKSYQFVLTNLNNIKKIRIDPQQYTGTSIIENITLQQQGIKPVHFNYTAGFPKFKAKHQIHKFLIDKNGLVTHSTGIDPFYTANLVTEKASFPWITVFFRYCFICFIIITIFLTFKNLNSKLKFVPILLVIVVTLAVIMAMLSRKNAHPDEYVHIEASKYYQKHWLPPAIEDPEIRHTYSEYGFSRLNKPEIYYIFAGKFARFTDFLQIKSFWLFRLFNVFLLSCLLLYSIKSTSARCIAMPFLISPQIWYVFSYCNSDAFSLFISFLVGVQIVKPNSTFNIYLKQQPDRYMFIRAIMAGILLGSMLLMKQNFYPYIAFVITVLAWQIWELGNKEEQKLVMKRLLVLILIGLSLFGMRRGADYYVNGFDKAEKIATIRSELAKPLFNPKTELAKQSYNLSMKERGVPLVHLIKERRFFEKTYRTLFGVYGYFTIAASVMYFDIVRWVGVALLLVFLGIIFRYSWRENSFITCSFLAFALALIVFSLIRSWTNDFQAQGRYLFPIVSMISIVYARNRKYLSGPILTSLIMAMFFLSGYSFIFVAIHQIPKALVH